MNRSPDPRTVVVTFRMTPAERKQFDQMRGKTSIADFLRRMIFGAEA